MSVCIIGEERYFMPTLAQGATTLQNIPLNAVKWEKTDDKTRRCPTLNPMFTNLFNKMECLVLFFYAKTKQFTESGKQIVPDQTALEQSDQELFCLHKLFPFE